jgi:4-hydroxythreonine-4-phosphate dehydrogenase
LTGTDQQVTLAVSMGDPRGIGPEVIAKALREPQDGVRLVVVGPEAVLHRTMADLGISAEVPRVGSPQEAPERPAVALDLGNFDPAYLEPRRPDACSGRAALQAIERAVELVQAGSCDALVTGPISKEAIAAAGSEFPGHTEMLAHLGGVQKPIMLMACPGLRVALVTTHMALSRVAGEVTAEKIVATGRILYQALRTYFGLPQPRVAICGLNPHCGDGGRFGNEEVRVIAPALRELARRGTPLDGPYPADTVFAKALAGGFDAVIAHYHDQGLVAVKMAGLDRVVNVTLGLPFIRTSVGHGTAFDIAGTGRASEGSFQEAVAVAAGMVRSARQAPGPL